MVGFIWFKFNFRYLLVVFLKLGFFSIYLEGFVVLFLLYIGMGVYGGLGGVY